MNKASLLLKRESPSENTEKNRDVFCSIIKLVILLQVIGMFLSPYILTIFNLNMDWISINRLWDIFCLIFMFFAIASKCRQVPVSPWLVASIYLVTQLVTVLIYSENVLSSAKALGLNANIVAVAVNIVIYFSLLHDKKMSEESVNSILRLLFGIGCFAILFSAVTEYEALLSSFSPQIGAYSAYVISFFGGKNFFGAILFFTITAGLYLYLYERKILYIIGMILQFIFLIATFSRAALLMVVVFGLSYILFEKKHTKSIKIIAIIIVILMVITYISNDNVAQFIDEKVIREQYGDAGRSIMWSQASSYMTRYNAITRTIFGIGYAEFEAIGASYVHNAYLEMFFVGGAIKLLFFISAVVYLLRLNLKTRKTGAIQSNLGLYTLFCYLAYAVFESKSLYHLGFVQLLFILYIHLIPQMLLNYHRSGKEDKKDIH